MESVFVDSQNQPAGNMRQGHRSGTSQGQGVAHSQAFCLVLIPSHPYHLLAFTFMEYKYLNQTEEEILGSKTERAMASSLSDLHWLNVN